jgi:hypothetical protein
MSLFLTQIDGEYRECPHCAEDGMGIDAWHPCTEEFWSARNKRLRFFACRACLAMADAKRRRRIKYREAA